MTSGNFESEPVECNRCGSEISGLEPVTTIQFSGAVDGHRTACYDCVEDVIEVWNDGTAIETEVPNE